MKGSQFLKPYAYQNLLVLWWRYADPRPSTFKITVNNIEVPRPLLGVAFKNSTECLLVGLVDQLVKKKTAAVAIYDDGDEMIISSSRRELKPFTVRDMESISIEDRLRTWGGLLTKIQKTFPSVSDEQIRQIASATALNDTVCAELPDSMFYFRTAWPTAETSKIINTSLKWVTADGTEISENIPSLVETSWIHCVMAMPKSLSMPDGGTILRIGKNKFIPLNFSNTKTRGSHPSQNPKAISDQHNGDTVALDNYLQQRIQNNKIQSLTLYDPTRVVTNPVFVKIDAAIVLPNIGLFISGSIVDPNNRTRTIRIHHADVPEGDLFQRSIRVPRLDIYSRYKRRGISLPHCLLGFHSLVRSLETNIGGSEISVTIKLTDDSYYRLPNIPIKTLNPKASLPVEIIFSLVEFQKALNPGVRLDDWAPFFKGITKWATGSARNLHLNTTPLIKEPVHLTIDMALFVQNEGLFLAGWKIDLGGNIQSIQVIDITGKSVQILDILIPGCRPDVYNVYSKQGLFFKNDKLGFHCLAPIEISDRNHSLCHLKISFVSGEEYRLPLKIESANIDDPLASIKKLLLTFPQTHPSLRQLLDEVVGPAVSSLWCDRRRPKISPTVETFGQIPDNPEVSIIVPLYGRSDFVMHQLSLFADDPDFFRNELIYILDDPRLYPTLIQTCHDIAPLFRVPFKLIHSEHNLGYSGANNLGVQYSKGKYLLLLNSDVMPREHGWLRQLTKLYKGVPKAGAMGVKLLYADGSIQHAGMAFERLPAWGGLWINDHPNKGYANEAESEMNPIKITAVTAACLMVEKAIFDRVGGFTEDYIIGDFEDSDLCFKIQMAGYQNWYAPSVELYHLERQSQSMPDERHWRTQLTLYNCWKHNTKWDVQIHTITRKGAKN